MPGFLHPAMLASLLSSCLLCGCSRNDDTSQASPPSLAAAQPAWENESREQASTQTADHPCQLLTDSQVRDVLPGATPGRRDDGLEKYGIATCVWNLPADRFIVQMFKVESGTVEDELRSRASGSVDPLVPRAASVRYVTVAGVGDQAMSVIEKADPQRGILADTAVLVTQRDGRRAVLFTGNSLAGGDRESALQSLETLGRSAAKRL